MTVNSYGNELQNVDGHVYPTSRNSHACTTQVHCYFRCVYSVEQNADVVVNGSKERVCKKAVKTHLRLSFSHASGESGENHGRLHSKTNSCRLHQIR
jgi:hypothetical protein